jgi:hypothetical protein
MTATTEATVVAIRLEIIMVASLQVCGVLLRVSRGVNQKR